MKIEKCLNTTLEEVQSRQFNVWFGISLGNTYFTADRIERYVKWAFEITKEKILIVIGDSIHAINLEVLDEKSESAALNRALKIGERKYNEIQQIISLLKKEQRRMIRVVRFKEASDSQQYQQYLRVILDAYTSNPHFKAFIRTVVKEGRPDRAEKITRLNEQQLDRLAEYVLYEIPLFINGVQINNDDTIYTLNVYPGLTKLDELFVGLNTKTMFPELAEKLEITNKIAIVEAYPD